MDRKAHSRSDMKGASEVGNGKGNSRAERQQRIKSVAHAARSVTSKGHLRREALKKAFLLLSSHSRNCRYQSRRLNFDLST